MVEIAGGAPEIVVAGREDDWERRAAASSARLGRVLRGNGVAAGLAAGSAVAFGAGGAAAMAAVAVPAVHAGALAGVLLAALVLLALASLEAVAPLGAAAASVDAVAAAAARLEAVTERPVPVAPPPAPRALPDSGPLAARAVGFGYAATPVLEGVDLVLEPGRAVALVGRSGAGKTTLAELLVRFRDPTQGAVTLGGVDVRALDPDELRASVRLAPQDAYLFATTIRANVALARPAADDAAIAGVLARVGLGTWLASLSAGLDTEVGEAGAQVSGGQRQRIAAARLVLSDARYLIFDEPTAHLDPGGARALLAELVALAHAERRAVLVITHEREWLEAFDAVYELP
jgi:ABC-type transport system involved in cytochrome bd biosynthesis fused ATPase/permease subunit